MSRFSIQTDSGTRYDENEDAVGYDESLALWLVADGMGGHAAGEVASKIARDTFIERIRTGESHTQAALSAHSQIVISGDEHEAQSGMGSTIVAMQIIDEHAALVWVGDSRVYLWRAGHLSVVTRDHSYVQTLIDQGQLSDATARNHPKRNMVTQVLGVGDPQPETAYLSLRPGDWLILCSDGLNDELTDGEIAELLESTYDVSNVAELLVSQAVQNGGRDNVSVIAVEYENPSKSHEIPEDVTVKSDGEIMPTAIWASIRRFPGRPLVLGLIAALALFLAYWIVIGFR
ncbi:MAG: protein phosphatase 2C domain-containing protein [Pseudomonadaceae bacterium]|nr:protein phosphatase 2C domain-containing protein [Pseudomonadaceae bacterium]